MDFYLSFINVFFFYYSAIYGCLNKACVALTLTSVDSQQKVILFKDRNTEMSKASSLNGMKRVYDVIHFLIVPPLWWMSNIWPSEKGRPKNLKLIQKEFRSAVRVHTTHLNIFPYMCKNVRDTRDLMIIFWSSLQGFSKIHDANPNKTFERRNLRHC